MAKPADVELKAITKRFGTVVAVEAVSLTIPAGTYTCILGPSGCGKTTTLRMLAGHERVTSGEIYLGHDPVTHLPPARRGTAMMFQNYALFPHLTCVDNVAFSLAMQGVPKTLRRERARDLLRLVHMDAFAERYPMQALGAHLTWTLPFGLLIMITVFNRFDKAYEEVAHDLGARGWQTVRAVILPIVFPSLVGVALFGFTLSYDEIARTSQSVGALNTLPLELQAMQTNATTPVIYALGTLTTALSFAVILTSLLVVVMVQRRCTRRGIQARRE